VKRVAGIVWIGLAVLTAIAVLWMGGINPLGELSVIFGDRHRLDPLPQDGAIQIYFNHNDAKGADFIDPDRGFKREGDNFEQVILDQFNQAQTSIDLAVQELRLPRLAQGLVAKQQSGIKVRVVLENLYNQTLQEAQNQPEDGDRLGSYLAYADQNQDGQISPEESQQRDAIQILRDRQIPVVDDTEDGSKGSGLMHHKFAVIDGKTVIVSSANFTPSGQYGDFDDPETRGNANNLVVLKSESLAQYFTEEFNYLWGDGPGGKPDSLFGINKPRRSPKVIKIGDTDVVVKFSPDRQATPFAETSNGLIARYLNQAQAQIQLALFVFSEQALANVINQRFQKGVVVKALIDRSFAFRSYSEGLDLLGVSLLDNCQVEDNNQPWALGTEFVGVPALPDGDKLHHKLALIDDHIIITGSHNWSPAANFNNDETVLILDNPAIAAHYQREFDRLYHISEFGIPGWLKNKIDRQNQECLVGTSPKPLATAVPNQLVNLNRATMAELETLPGIGPSLAQRIIDARPITSFEDLDKVNGIGPAKLKALEGKVSW
jgi:phosphatidylserine/phosphatidylglycerophosphate/cardiolipin synthase-like enzyme